MNKLESTVTLSTTSFTVCIISECVKLSLDIVLKPNSLKVVSNFSLSCFVPVRASNLLSRGGRRCYL